MSDLYRKSSLEKLSSPEQLDKMREITSPMFWIGAIGGGIIIIVALLWSVFARLPINVQSNGIFISKGGIQTVYAGNPGIVAEILVSKGETVSQNTVLARFDTKSTQLKIEKLEERRNALKAVTLESAGEAATADNMDLLDIKARIQSLSANLTGYEALKARFEGTKAAALENFDSQIREAQKELESQEIRSGIPGKVTTMDIVVGSALQAGSPVCTISQTERPSELFVVVCYVPISEGKKIKEGMVTMVYPSTVNPQEHGHIDGTVSEVADYVTSMEEVRNRLGDSSLVQAFTDSGPVVMVTCELEEDPDTASGYKWSGKKGATVTIAPGTMVSVDIVTEEKAPITMLIPFLKEKLSVQREKDKKKNE
ncbi:MAG: NHLP bacteriocin system secretion protein [Lachnospiraceae bacterium]|nr:NHLP bacteriocin system secretion protein [Lachnospiraceae bacterium]